MRFPRQNPLLPRQGLRPRHLLLWGDLEQLGAVPAPSAPRLEPSQAIAQLVEEALLLDARRLGALEVLRVLVGERGDARAEGAESVVRGCGVLGGLGGESDGGEVPERIERDGERGEASGEYEVVGKGVYASERG